MVLEEYEKLRDDLNYHTCHESSIRRVTRHPTYQKIVDLGKDIVPIILAEFDHYDQTDEEEWFPGWWAMSALHALTGVSPEITQPGVLRHMVRVWIKWGIENGHLAKDRPKYQKTPPVIYKGWVVVGRRHGEDSVLCPKREPRARWEEQMGTAAWVSKIDAARRVDDGWWKEYAWILPTKKEAEMVLDVLNEKIKNGECSDFNRPDKAWVEEIK